MREHSRGCQSARFFLTALALVALGAPQLHGQTVYEFNGIVCIFGTADDDRAVVRNAAGNTYQVKLNGEKFRFPREDVHTIIFTGCDGDDDFINNTGVYSLANGGRGEDYLVASTGIANFYGGPDDDIIVGGTESDFLIGGSEHDVIYGNGGYDDIYGDGFGYIDEQEEFEVLPLDLAYEARFEIPCFDDPSQEDGDDILYGGADGDYIEAGGGNDSVYGGSGDDFIQCGEGEDRAFGSSGSDCIEGGNGKDYLNGGSGNDSLAGGNDNDRLFGMSGDDTLFGGSGNDNINGGSGDNMEEQGGPDFCNRSCRDCDEVE